MAHPRRMKVMRASLLVLAGVLTWSPLAFGADPLTRSVQEALVREGFFEGQPDGQPGPDTTSALRRFQIRNGLEVTGEANAETLRALGLSPGGPAAPPPTPAPTPPPQPPRVPPSAPERERPEPPRSSASPEVEQSTETRRSLTAPVLSDLFRGTLYATAPAYVRVDVLRSAQARLRSLGLYDGEIDGIPGPSTTRALVAFQRRQQLAATGRLDGDTLHLLGLLPRVIPGPMRPYGPPPVVPPPYRRPPQVPPAVW